MLQQPIDPTTKETILDFNKAYKYVPTKRQSDFRTAGSLSHANSRPALCTALRASSRRMPHAHTRCRRTSSKCASKQARKYTVNTTDTCACPWTCGRDIYLMYQVNIFHLSAAMCACACDPSRLAKHKHHRSGSAISIMWPTKLNKASRLPLSAFVAEWLRR
jgi:hypothetical protein